MKKISKTEYNREYMRERKGYKTRQEKNNITKNGERLTIIIPAEHKDKLKAIALSQEKGVNQLLRELIQEFLVSQPQ